MPAHHCCSARQRQPRRNIYASAGALNSYLAYAAASTVTSSANITADAAPVSVPTITADNAACSGLGCAQELLDTIGRPLSSVASILPQGSLGPGLAIVAVVGGLLSWRSWVYFQRELFVASTIGRYVPKGRAKVIQINGTTRDVYYYPEGTISVEVVGSNINPGLMQQAGYSAKIPVTARKQSPANLKFQATGSLDAVVAFDGLASVGDQAPQYFAEVARVLKPGAPFIFFDRLKGEGTAAIAQPIVGSFANRIDESQLLEIRQTSDLVDVRGGTKLEGQDPHAVGVAFRRRETARAGFASQEDDMDPADMLRRRRRKPRTRK